MAKALKAIKLGGIQTFAPDEEGQLDAMILEAATEIVNNRFTIAQHMEGGVMVRLWYQPEQSQAGYQIELEGTEEASG
jgi:hypothetical protein